MASVWLRASCWAYRLLMVWVYDRTGSLPIAMLMHASLSACPFALGPEKVNGLALVAYGFTLAGAWWTVVLVVAAIGSGRLSAGPGKTPPFRTPNGELISVGIAEITDLCLGGIDRDGDH